jgi:organic hydroperoxide reductase OsmC/OhrA
VGTRAKEFRYSVDLQEGGTLRTEDGTPLGDTAEWTPEHLLLAGLIRCTLKSLRHHAARAGIEVADVKGAGNAMVTRRESDGRYAMTESDVSLEVRLVPLPGEDELAELLAKAERDCFIGASLTVKTDYRWAVT